MAIQTIELREAIDDRTDNTENRENRGPMNTRSGLTSSSQDVLSTRNKLTSSSPSASSLLAKPGPSGPSGPLSISSTSSSSVPPTSAAAASAIASVRNRSLGNRGVGKSSGVGGVGGAGGAGGVSIAGGVSGVNRANGVGGPAKENNSLRLDASGAHLPSKDQVAAAIAAVRSQRSGKAATPAASSTPSSSTPAISGRNASTPASSTLPSSTPAGVTNSKLLASSSTPSSSLVAAALNSVRNRSQNGTPSSGTVLGSSVGKSSAAALASAKNGINGTKNVNIGSDKSGETKINSNNDNKRLAGVSGGADDSNNADNTEGGPSLFQHSAGKLGPLSQRSFSFSSDVSEHTHTSSLYERRKLSMGASRLNTIHSHHITSKPRGLNGINGGIGKQKGSSVGSASSPSTAQLRARRIMQDAKKKQEAALSPLSDYDSDGSNVSSSVVNVDPDTAKHVSHFIDSLAMKKGGMPTAGSTSSATKHATDYSSISSRLQTNGPNAVKGTNAGLSVNVSHPSHLPPTSPRIDSRSPYSSYAPGTPSGTRYPSLNSARNAMASSPIAKKELKVITDSVASPESYASPKSLISPTSPASAVSPASNASTLSTAAKDILEVSPTHDTHNTHSTHDSHSRTPRNNNEPTPRRGNISRNVTPLHGMDGGVSESVVETVSPSAPPSSSSGKSGQSGKSGKSVPSSAAYHRSVPLGVGLNKTESKDFWGDYEFDAFSSDSSEEEDDDDEEEKEFEDEVDMDDDMDGGGDGEETEDDDSKIVPMAESTRAHLGSFIDAVVLDGMEQVEKHTKHPKTSISSRASRGSKASRAARSSSTPISHGKKKKKTAPYEGVKPETEEELDSFIESVSLLEETRSQISLDVDSSKKVDVIFPPELDMQEMEKQVVVPPRFPPFAINRIHISPVPAFKGSLGSGHQEEEKESSPEEPKTPKTPIRSNATLASSKEREEDGSKLTPRSRPEIERIRALLRNSPRGTPKSCQQEAKDGNDSMDKANTPVTPKSAKSPQSKDVDVQPTQVQNASTPRKTSASSPRTTSATSGKDTNTHSTGSITSSNDLKRSDYPNAMEYIAAKIKMVVESNEPSTRLGNILAEASDLGLPLDVVTEIYKKERYKSSSIHKDTKLGIGSNLTTKSAKQIGVKPSLSTEVAEDVKELSRLCDRATEVVSQNSIGSSVANKGKKASPTNVEEKQLAELVAKVKAAVMSDDPSRDFGNILADAKKRGFSIDPLVEAYKNERLVNKNGGAASKHVERREENDAKMEEVEARSKNEDVSLPPPQSQEQEKEDVQVPQSESEDEAASEIPGLSKTQVRQLQVIVNKTEELREAETSPRDCFDDAIKQSIGSSKVLDPTPSPSPAKKGKKAKKSESKSKRRKEKKAGSVEEIDEFFQRFSIQRDDEHSPSARDRGSPREREDRQVSFSTSEMLSSHEIDDNDDPDTTLYSKRSQVAELRTLESGDSAVLFMNESALEVTFVESTVEERRKAMKKKRRKEREARRALREEMLKSQSSEDQNQNQKKEILPGHLGVWKSPWERNRIRAHKSREVVKNNENLVNGVEAAANFAQRSGRSKRRQCLMPLEKRTEGHDGFMDIDFYSLYQSTTVQAENQEIDDAPWEYRDVRQRFLHEKSVESRNWFGTFEIERCNDRVSFPVCRPKSLEVSVTRVPDPEEWSEDWYTTWQSRRDNPNNLVTFAEDDSLTLCESDEGGVANYEMSDFPGKKRVVVEIGSLSSVRVKAGERVSRVHPDFTSSLRRSRWRKKYLKGVLFPKE